MVVPLGGTNVMFGWVGRWPMATLGIEPQTPGKRGDDANLVTSKGTYLARPLQPGFSSPSYQIFVPNPPLLPQQMKQGLAQDP